MAWEHAPIEIKELVRDVARSVFHVQAKHRDIDAIIQDALALKLPRADCRIFRRVVVNKILEECKIFPYPVPMSIVAYWLGINKQNVKVQLDKYRTYYNARQKAYYARKKAGLVQRTPAQREGSSGNQSREPSE